MPAGYSSATTRNMPMTARYSTAPTFAKFKQTCNEWALHSTSTRCYQSVRLRKRKTKHQVQKMKMVIQKMAMEASKIIQLYQRLLLRLRQRLLYKRGLTPRAGLT